MKRGVGLLVAAVLGLSACGGGSGDGTAAAAPPSDHSPSATPSASPSAATYFADADSTAVNKVAVPAQDAMAAAIQKSAQCDKAGKERGYGAWRSCWHHLLDPVVRGLRGTTGVLDRLASGDLPETCVASLGRFSGILRGHADKAADVLSGIDSDDRGAQRRALRRMDPVLRAAHGAFAEQIPVMTSACYSPEDLASIKASASPAPSVSPSG